MNIRAILFDKDGTLADFPATFNPATGRVIDQISNGDQSLAEAIADVWDYDLEAGKIRDTSIIVAGSGLDITLALRSVMDIGDPSEYSKFLDRIYGDICEETVHAIEGAEVAIRQLAQLGFVLGVATNDSEANANSQMRSLGMHSFFSRIFGADSGFGGKPGPGMINAFVEHHGFAPNEVLMVGDSTHDLEAGRAASVSTCGVETGPASRRELEPMADLVLPSVAALPAWLMS